MMWQGITLLLLSALNGAFAQTDGSTDHVLEIHGAGTTNPSKCLWLLQTQTMDRTRVPVHMTYRAVGSSTGIYEFMGVNHTSDFAYKNYNDFGAADIPLHKEDYDALQANNISMVQLPFVLGSVGVFYHSLTDSDKELDSFASDAQPTVNLTACDLAKIFKREIKFWDHEELLANNPNLENVLPSGKASYPIHVARRVAGSSSTKSLTLYLNAGCPAEWPADMVGTTVDWEDDTMGCEGSAGVSDCLVDNPGAIGYMESGHGWSQNFKEVELKNADGRFLSSRYAASVGGIGSAAGDIPASADMDFSGVNLINRPGEYTWPITLMSYIFVRKNLGAWMDHPQERTLLKAFLKGLYDDRIISQCSQFGFVHPTKNT
jgi:ABC-type phosphate transport system substrate-binding protein